MWLFNSERTRVVKGFKKSVCEKLNEVQDLLTSNIAVIHVLIEEGYLKPIIKSVETHLENFIGYTKSADFLTKLNKKIKENKTK